MCAGAGWPASPRDRLTSSLPGPTALFPCLEVVGSGATQVDEVRWFIALVSLTPTAVGNVTLTTVIEGRGVHD